MFRCFTYFSCAPEVLAKCDKTWIKKGKGNSGSIG